MWLAMPYNTLLTTAPLLTSQWKLLSNYRAYLGMSNMSGRVWRLVDAGARLSFNGGHHQAATQSHANGACLCLNR